VIENPDFSSKPNADDMARYYPDRAQRMGVEGRATFRCTVTAQGKLTDCVITAEDPPGQDFGKQTLQLTKTFKMRAKTLDGVPTSGGIFQKTIVWRLAKD